MWFDLQPGSGNPIYRQIVEQIRRQINSGQLQPGDELPSVRRVAERHTVNPMTVSRAYSLLERDGFLIRQRGRPMTVAGGGKSGRSTDERLKLIEPSLEQIAMEARQLGLDSDEVTALLAKIMDKE